MALDHDQFEALLSEAQAYADRAASENDAQHYRQAFEASLKAMRLLAEESGAWRKMVARATEEFEGDEGI
jgi:regulator of protease activity HflC (stomatin/prohibitin superfamily)